MEETQLAEEQARESSPEEVQLETAADESAETEQTEEPQQNRFQERISDLVSARKQAEARAQELEARLAEFTSKGQETEYDLEGVTEEGIDPKKFAESLERKLTERFAEKQEVSRYKREADSIRAEPEMRDPSFQRDVIRAAKAEGLSPMEAFLQVRQERQEAGRPAAAAAARQETGAPQRGGTGNAPRDITPDDVAKMSADEYMKYRERLTAL